MFDVCCIQIQVVRTINVHHFIITAAEITGGLDEKGWRLLFWFFGINREQLMYFVSLVCTPAFCLKVFVLVQISYELCTEEHAVYFYHAVLYVAFI